MRQSHIPRRIKTCIMQLFEKISDFYNVKKNAKEKFEHFCQEFMSPRKVYLDFDFPDTIFFRK